MKYNAGHNEYEVWITESLAEDEEAMPEYQPTVEDPDLKTIACHIASEAGKSFVVCCKNHTRSQFMAFYIFMDGQEVDRVICGPGEETDSPGLYTSAEDYAPFQFADIVTTDEESLLSTVVGEGPAELGVIEVRVYRCNGLGREASRDNTSRANFACIGAVHERSKKAGAHCVRVGSISLKDEDCGFGTAWMPQYLDPPSRPRAKFIFRYRSMNILRAQGIVPSQELPNLLPPATGRQQAITVDAESTAGPSEQQRTSTPDRDMKSGIIVIDAEEDIQQDTTIGAGPVTGPSEQPRVSTRRQPHVLTHDVDMDTSERPHASAPDVEMEPNVDVVEKEEVEDVDMLKRELEAVQRRLNRAMNATAGSSSRIAKKEEPHDDHLAPPRKKTRTFIDLTLDE